jgi:hypothetical protein
VFALGFWWLRGLAMVEPPSRFLVRARVPEQLQVHGAMEQRTGGY